RLAVMANGRLVQVGGSREVYDQPASRFVAGFLGDSNFLPGTVRQLDGSHCVVETVVGMVVGTCSGKPLAEGSRPVGSIRPPSFKLVLEGSGTSAEESTQIMPPGEEIPQTENRIMARVEEVAFLGDLTQVRLQGNAQTPLLVLGLPHALGKLKKGDVV